MTGAAEFLSAIWGADAEGNLGGVHFIAESRPEGWKQHPVKTVAAAMAKAGQVSDAGRNTYFACAEYMTADNRKGERVDPRYATRIYRVAEMGHIGDLDAWLIDHHAGEAWWKACSFASRGFAPDHLPSDTRKVADVVARWPEYLRDRLDPVFEGLAKTIDPERYYEGVFTEWQDGYYSAMQTAYAMSTSSPAEERNAVRLRLCRNAASESFPELVEWFDMFRERVCDGGRDHRWLDGDQVLHEGRLNPAWPDSTGLPTWER